MSDYKKYYYLKLKDNFFDTPEIKAIEGMQNGYEYICIIQKMYLRSLKRNGKLMLTDTIPYDINTLSSVLNHRSDSIKTAIELFIQLGLIQLLDDKTIYMLHVQNFVGESSTEADRIREYRKSIAEPAQKKEPVQMYDKCTPEIKVQSSEIKVKQTNTNTSCPEVDLLVDKKSIIEKTDYNLLANKCYSVYIRKEGKQESIKAIISAIKRLEKENKDGEWLYERIKLYSELISWKEKQFIPLASTWCNKERYFDDEQSWINPKEEQYNNESYMYPVYPMLCGEEQRKADEAYEREQEEKKKALVEAEKKAEADFLKTQDFINDLIK